MAPTVNGRNVNVDSAPHTSQSSGEFRVLVYAYCDFCFYLTANVAVNVYQGSPTGAILRERYQTSLGPSSGVSFDARFYHAMT